MPKYIVIVSVEAANEDAAVEKLMYCSDTSCVKDSYPDPEELWLEDPDFPRSDWHVEVANEYTLLGYWQWVSHQKEFRDGEAQA